MRFGFVVLVALASLGHVGAVDAACRDDRVEMRGDWGSIRFRVDVADEPDERAQGLMHVPQMPRLNGMLFVYDREQRVSFWMRNTLIPLDMIFMDGSGTVMNIHENAIPLDETPIFGGSDIQYVLEINGGLSADFGIAPGTVMRHPAVDAARAAWPCAEE